MAALRDAVAPEREDLTVECRECRRTLPASDAVIQENVSHSDRGVLSVTRHYYCSQNCAERLCLEAARSTAVATDGGERDGFVTVTRRLQDEFPSVLLQVYNDRTEHIAYWDESPDTIDADMLAYIQSQGFEILEIGRKECVVTDQEQGWVEFRRHDPGEVFEKGGERR